MAFKIKPKAPGGAQLTPPPQKVAELMPPKRIEKERADEEAVPVPVRQPEVTQQVRADVSGLSASLDAAVRRAEKAERDASEAKIRSDATIQSLAAKVEAKEKERDEARAEAKAAKDALATKGDTLSAAESQLLAVRSERDWARNAKATADERAEGAESELAAAKADHDKTKTAHEDTKKQLTTARGALDAKEGELTDARDEKVAATREMRK